MRADQFVRVGVVGDDIGAAGDRHRIDGVWRNADGTGELDRAVFVSVLKANVQNRGLIAPIQAFFQLFFADAFDGHALFSLCLNESSRWRGGSYAERREAGVSRGRNGNGRGALAVCCRGKRAGTVTRAAGSSWTAQPFDRFPQWMQRRKIDPDEQVIPKSWRPER